jgi:hypothetical protein
MWARFFFWGRERAHAGRAGRRILYRTPETVKPASAAIQPVHLEYSQGMSRSELSTESPQCELG